MTDQEIRKQYQPLQIPAHFDQSAPLNQQILFALAQIGHGIADEVVRQLKGRCKGTTEKQEIAGIHQQLTDWYKSGLVAAQTNQSGELIFSLQKII